MLWLVPDLFAAEDEDIMYPVSETDEIGTELGNDSQHAIGGPNTCVRAAVVEVCNLE